MNSVRQRHTNREQELTYTAVPSTDSSSSITVAPVADPALQRITDTFFYYVAKLTPNFKDISFENLSEEDSFNILKSWMTKPTDDKTNKHADTIAQVEKRLKSILPKLSEPHRFELAKLHLAHAKSWNVCDVIKHYDLTEPHRFEIVINEWSIDKKGEFFTLVNLEPEHFVALYKKFLKKTNDVHVHYGYIQSLNLTDTQSLELALALALRLGERFSLMVPLFKLNSKQRAQVFLTTFSSYDSFDLSKNFHEQNPSVIYKHGERYKNIDDIQYYNLDKSDYLNVLDVLTQSKSSDLYNFYTSIMKYPYPEYQLDIAKIFAHNQPDIFSSYIKGFSFDDEEMFEVVKASLKGSVEITLHNIKAYTGMDKRKDDIIKEALLINPLELLEFKNGYQIDDNVFLEWVNKLRRCSPARQPKKFGMIT